MMVAAQNRKRGVSVSVKNAPSSMSKEPTPTGNQPPQALNPYSEVVRKRLRSLLKKMQKIEKYETLPQDKLEDDQIQVVVRKSEIQSSIKELKEILVSLDAVYASQQKEQIERALQTQRQQDEKYSSIRKEAVERIEKKYESLFDALFVVNVVLSREGSVVGTMKDIANNEALVAFCDTVKSGSHISQGSVCDREEYVSFFKNFVRPYTNSSPKPFALHHTFRDLSKVVNAALKEFSEMKERRSTAQVPESQSIAVAQQPSNEYRLDVSEDSQFHMAQNDPNTLEEYVTSASYYQYQEDIDLSNPALSLAAKKDVDISYTQNEVSNYQAVTPEHSSHYCSEEPSKTPQRRHQPQAYQDRSHPQKRPQRRSYTVRSPRQYNTDRQHNADRQYNHTTRTQSAAYAQRPSNYNSHHQPGTYEDTYTYNSDDRRGLNGNIKESVKN